MMVRRANEHDAGKILSLYRRVAANPGGIARSSAEIDAAYVHEFLGKAISDGIALVIEKDSVIAAEMHAYRPGIQCFSHVLSNLTIVVDPGLQGMGLGTQLFEAFLSTVAYEHPDITRVELVARESNSTAIRLYKSIGFEVEGTLAGRIKNADGSIDADIPMAWLRAG